MSLTVVLHRTQDLVNIAGVVRVMKNFDLTRLRLVAPEAYDPHRIEGIAHSSYDILERAEMFEGLDQALADCTFVAGLTARERTHKFAVARPREAAPTLVALAEEGTVALVLGPEDRGLTNAELDRCHMAVTIPTSPRFPSMNLAHACAVMAYELSLVRGERPLKPPRRSAPPAVKAELEELFGDAARALGAIDFFKTRNPESVMRTLRGIVYRAALDRREAKLLRAMCIEVVRYLERGRRA